MEVRLSILLNFILGADIFSDEGTKTLRDQNFGTLRTLRTSEVDFGIRTRLVVATVPTAF